VLRRFFLSGDDDIATARTAIRTDDQRAELALDQTISVYDFCRDGRDGQLTIWHDTGIAAIDLGEGSLWGFWDEDAETILVDDGDYVRRQFNTSGELVAELGR
jgi:hypothetical protein